MGNDKPRDAELVTSRAVGRKASHPHASWEERTHFLLSPGSLCFLPQPEQRRLWAGRAMAPDLALMTLIVGPPPRSELWH